jgi:SAM-dependent methyltransferase
MNNYEFCAQWVLDQTPEKSVRVLDYGCGAGQIVQELRKKNINAFGCDVFYEGGDFSKFLDAELVGDRIIRRIEENIIPFEDASFDFVINNQVMEHVENLDDVLAEIHRVLKPGGLILSLFPDKGVWREGHCGIPFLHWFPKGSRTSIYYAAAFRTLGFGHYKKGKSIMQWSRDFREWLDKWTYYRSRREINSTYTKYFGDIKHIEDFWLQLRLGNKKHWVAWLPPPCKN